MKENLTNSEKFELSWDFVGFDEKLPRLLVHTYVPLFHGILMGGFIFHSVIAKYFRTFNEALRLKLSSHWHCFVGQRRVTQRPLDSADVRLNSRCLTFFSNQFSSLSGRPLQLMLCLVGGDGARAKSLHFGTMLFLSDFPEHVITVIHIRAWRPLAIRVIWKMKLYRKVHRLNYKVRTLVHGVCTRGTHRIFDPTPRHVDRKYEYLWYEIPLFHSYIFSRCWNDFIKRAWNSAKKCLSSTQNTVYTYVPTLHLSCKTYVHDVFVAHEHQRVSVIFALRTYVPITYIVLNVFYACYPR